MRPDNAAEPVLNAQELQQVARALARMNEQGWGLAIGLLFGVSLLVATVTLVLKGGQVVGPHLGLLSVYFPGYSVTLLGGMVGFFYAFAVGYGIGRVVSAIYNRLIPLFGR